MTINGVKAPKVTPLSKISFEGKDEIIFLKICHFSLSCRPSPNSFTDPNQITSHCQRSRLSGVIATMIRIGTDFAEYWLLH